MNSWAEQMAIVQELIDKLDATLVEPGQAVRPPAAGPYSEPFGRGRSAASSHSPGSANVTGLERARQLAAQAISLQPDPIPEQPELFG